jgi:hypothetical protein
VITGYGHTAPVTQIVHPTIIDVKLDAERSFTCSILSLQLEWITLPSYTAGQPQPDAITIHTGNSTHFHTANSSDPSPIKVRVIYAGRRE